MVGLRLDLTKLPRPDNYGNYWFGHRKIPADAAIYPSKARVDERVVRTGTWILFLGTELGFVYDKGNLARYDSTEAALAELRRRLG